MLEIISKNVKFYCSDKIEVTFFVNNCKILLSFSIFKVLFNLSISARAFAPSLQILLSSKIIAKSKNNWVVSAQ